MKTDFSNMMQSVADVHGDKEALVNIERNRRFTHAQYHKATNQIANMLEEKLSLGKGDVYLSILDNDNLSLLHFPTVLKGKATAAWTSFRDSLEEHRWQLECVKPKVVFVENVLLENYYDMLVDMGISIVCMDKPAGQHEQVPYFWDLLEGVADSNPHNEWDDRKDTVLIRFTGGTTGKGKPAMYSIENWLSSRDSFLALPELVWNDQIRTLHVAPISHGSLLFIMPTLFSGGCNVTMNLPDLVEYCRNIEKERITHSFLVPTLLYRLLELPEVESCDMSSLDTMFYGAAPMSPAKLELLQNKFGNIFAQVYGSTEHCGASLYFPKSKHKLMSDSDRDRLSAAGYPTLACEVVIKDEDGNIVKQGDVGELWMRSKMTSQGYFNNPEKTNEEFRNGFWLSGDMAFLDKEGFVHIVDRKKDIIISGGFNIYATEVEAAVNEHPSILMSAVVGVPSEEWGEAVHAEVMLRGEEGLDKQSVIDFVKEKIGRYKAPKSVKVVEALPVSVAGKVLRRQVREKYWDNQKRSV